MSIDVMSGVWKHSTNKGTALLVLLAIADHADENGLAWPGGATIGQRARIGSRAVITHIKKLEASGELAVYRREGMHNFYFVRVGLTNENYRTAIQRLSKITSTHVETITSSIEEEPVIKRSPPPDQAITGTPDQAITRSAIGTIKETLDIAADAATVEIEHSEHQVMFGELCEVFGYDPKTLDKSDEKEIGGVVGKLRAKKAKPGDIKAEFHWLKNVRGPSLGFSTFTMHAMVTHHKDFRVWQQKTLNATPIGLTPDQLAMREAHTLLSQAAAHE